MCLLPSLSKTEKASGRFPPAWYVVQRSLLLSILNSCLTSSWFPKPPWNAWKPLVVSTVTQAVQMMAKRNESNMWAKRRWSTQYHKHPLLGSSGYMCSLCFWSRSRLGEACMSFCLFRSEGDRSQSPQLPFHGGLLHVEIVVEYAIMCDCWRVEIPNQSLLVTAYLCSEREYH